MPAYSHDYPLASRARMKIKAIAYWLLPLFAGAIGVLGFAPFHHPSASIIALALLYFQLQTPSPKQAWLLGLTFGLGWMGLGVSWVAVSVYLYGHLPIPAAIGITALFILYLSLYPALCCALFRCLASPKAPIRNALLFSSLWCLSEYLRAHCMTGFPWLLLGYAHMDSPLHFLFPWLGIYGVGFLSVLASVALFYSIIKSSSQWYWLIFLVFILDAPIALKQNPSTFTDKKNLSFSLIQANLSMRDKWDEGLFWQIIHHYQKATQSLMGKAQLIILPESAIPLPATYVRDWLNELNRQAKTQGTAILLGIPEQSPSTASQFYNTVIGLGTASGSYRKQQLVPFGEYIPKPFRVLVDWLGIPQADMLAGPDHPPLIKVNRHPFASLICYELAYPEILRQQLPQAEWILSLSDDGWFGHSLAMYQQLQMAQVFSSMSHRYQLLANNSGLSSLIDAEGRVIHSLPAHQSGVLKGELSPLTDQTPWMLWGDYPVLILCCLMILGIILTSFRDRNYQ